MYYGVEGVTFNWGTDESGERIPILMDHMATTANPQGQSMYEQGFVKGMYYPAEYALAATGQGDTMPTQNALSVHPFLRNSNHIIWSLSSDDSDMLADLEVVVRDVRDEYGSKFLMGTLDPNDDGDWKRLPGRPGARRPGAGPRDPRHQQGGLRTVLGRYVTPTLRGHLPHRGRCPFRCSGEGDERRLTPSRRRTRT